MLDMIGQGFIATILRKMDFSLDKIVDPDSLPGDLAGMFGLTPNFVVPGFNDDKQDEAAGRATDLRFNRVPGQFQNRNGQEQFDPIPFQD
jgi:hypothetical protein